MVEGEAVSRQHEPGDGFLAVLRRLHPWHRVERRDEVIGKVAGKPAGKPLEPRGSDPEPAHARTDGVEGIGRLDAGGSLADTGVAGDRQRAVRGNGDDRSRSGADERVAGGLLAPLERLQQEPRAVPKGGVKVGWRRRGERDLYGYRDDKRPTGRVRRGNGLLVSRGCVQLSWSAVQSTGITPSPAAGRATL